VLASVNTIPGGEVVTVGKFLVNHCDAVVLFDSGASHSFVSSDFVSKHNLRAVTLDKGSYCISATRNNISTNQVVLEATLEIGDRQFLADVVVLPGVGIDVILGMKWTSGNGVLIDITTRVVMLRDPSTKEAFLVQLPRDIHIHSMMNAVTSRAIKDIPVVCEFLAVFPDDFSGIPSDRDVEFKIELLPSTVLEDRIECRQMSYLSLRPS